MVKKTFFFVCLFFFFGAGFFHKKLEAFLPGIIAFKFNRPYDIVVDSKGALFISDWSDCIIYKIDQWNPFGTGDIWKRVIFVGERGKCEIKDGLGMDSRLGSPKGLGIDTSDNIYLVDYDPREDINQIRKIDPTGNVTTLSITDSDEIKTPTGSWNDVAVDQAGNLFITDDCFVFPVLYGDARIRKIDSSGKMTTFAVFGPPLKGEIPQFLTFGDSNKLYTSGTNLSSIDTSGRITPLGKKDGHTDGPLASAVFAHNIAGTGYQNNRLVLIEEQSCIPGGDCIGGTIREIKISASPTVSTLAGKSGYVGYVDGSGDSSRFGIYPYGLAIGKGGEAYMADASNYVIRTISATGDMETLKGMAFY